MSSSNRLRHRVRSALLRVARFVPRGRGSDRPPRDGQIAASQRASATDEVATGNAEATSLRSAALAAFRSRDFERTVHLTDRLEQCGDVTFADGVRWAQAAHKIGSGGELLRAQRALLTFIPVSEKALGRAVRALQGFDANHLTELETWRTQVVDQRPEFDTTALDRLVLAVRVRHELTKEPLPSPRRP